jgi:hypothetical protein
LSRSLTCRPAALLIAALTLGAAAAPGHAEERVQVTVLAILATEDNAKVDEQLKCIAQKVQKVEPKLTGFRLARTSAKSLEVSKVSKFTLVDGLTVGVTVEHGADEKNRVGLTVKPPQIGEISYTSCCGKYFPIVTRYRTADKERLIIAIMVEPCKKKCD